MSAIDPAMLAGAVARAKTRMASLEQELNAADSRLGDGDTGVMLARVVDAMSQIDYAVQPDMGAALALMAHKTAGATGSSLGTLIATGLLAVSKRVKGEGAIAFADLGGHLAAAVDAMAARGGAKLGDKTVLDVLDAMARAASGQVGAEAVTRSALEAGRAALEAFRDRPCRVGRARMFGEKSLDIDDPGMLAAYELALAAAASPTS